MTKIRWTSKKRKGVEDSDFQSLPLQSSSLRMSPRLKKKKVEEAGTEASPIRLSTPVPKTSTKKMTVKKSKEKEKKTAAKEEKGWKLLLEFEENEGKVFSNFGSNEKYEPGDDDKSQHIDGNMLILSCVSKGQSFDGKAQETSRSSELEVKTRLRRVEEDLASVKNEDNGAVGGRKWRCLPSWSNENGSTRYSPDLYHATWLDEVPCELFCCAKCRCRLRTVGIRRRE
ncbi:hypothetical protein TorRG33x02_184980 [Trema orientale]|uniref:Uncharacterized protein n=1 Tax=Trema orientale TaxID=63057 RepID=A0A2P5EJF7_TREOI|nr:hypothetical protein TorRG33x02_184980 [Trema orientale]